MVSEEHKLTYTQLHKEFSRSLEESIDRWLHSKGITEDAFGEMMQLARRRGDAQSDEIVGVLLGMLDYQLWIVSIFALKHSSQLDHVQDEGKGYPNKCDVSGGYTSVHD
eukprot:TRINITY_DN4456_c0_g1_i1.p1 TRINITY_DN4456_c0_g1~~TRINITY_DN4456_c0_g1_i1.p1  ORF type:complete len:109 (+),score=26.07 TRINITY_DN4456_c0_g1_i1:142-468(+)